MATKKNHITEDNLDAVSFGDNAGVATMSGQNMNSSEAANTLHPQQGSNGVGDMSYTQQMARLLATVAAQPPEVISQIEGVLAQVGKEQNPQGDAAHNQATILAKPSAAEGKGPTPYHEDVQALFGSEELSEEFKTKTQNLFEAAVNARVIVETAQIRSEVEKELNEQLDESISDLIEKMDSYLNHVVEEWMQENEIAIASSLKVDVVENFIAGLKNLFQESYIEVPEDKVDVIAELANKVEELTANYNKLMEDKIEADKKLEESAKTMVFAEVSKGLADTQVEKLKMLSEGLDFIDVDSYTQKLNFLKENNFKNATKRTQVLNEDTGSISDPLEKDNEETVITDATMKTYADAISRTVR